MPPTMLACRLSSYGPYESLAFEHLSGLGIRYVELPLPPPDKIDATEAELAKFNLSATSLHGECDVGRDDVADQIRVQMPACRELGARILFVSTRADGTPLEVVRDRLRQAGDEAARAGVTIALETHPDLVTNADVALETMKAVDHPHVRINFDTANVYFYNRGVNAVDQLRRIAPYVASVHLKDTDGGYESWHFPALGRGVVDFAGVFSVLDAAGFSGPCTLEIEGIEGETLTERLVCDRIAESLGYLRGLGRV